MEEIGGPALDLPALPKKRVDITYVVFCSSVSKRLDNTLLSIVRQNKNFSHEIVLVGSVKRNVMDAYIRKQSDFPWFSGLRALLRADWDDAANKADHISGDLVICLKSGDCLYPDAIMQMSARLDATGTDLVLAAAGNKAAAGNMTADKITDDFFQSTPSSHVSTDNVHSVTLTTYLTKTSRTQVRLFRRSLLVEHGDRLNYSILHEYVCEKRSSRNYPEAVLLDNTQILKPGKHLSASPPPDADGQKPIWLFGERRGNSAEENGWVFFKHCVDNAPDVDCYFVVNSGIALPEDDDRYNDRIITKGGVKWNIIVGQTSHFIFTDSVADILHTADDLASYPDAKCIYLTHGVLAYSPGVYQKKHDYFDLITCASKQDIRAASRQWDYSVGRFVETGLARWDQLHDFEAKKEILFSLTWRKSLNTQKWSEKHALTAEDVNAFRATDYYQAIRGILHSERLIAALKEKGCTLNVALHFRVRHLFMDEIAGADGAIELYDPESSDRNFQDLLKDAALLVTDYSSVMWDMAYMKKPVVLYQFDKSHMLCERHLTQFSIPNFDDVFDVSTSQDRVIERIEHYLGNGFEADPAHLARQADFFTFTDANNCARILEAIRVGDAEQEKLRPDPSVYVPNKDDRSLDTGILAHDLHDGRVVSAISDYLAYSLEKGTEAIAPEGWRERIREARPSVFLVEPNLDGRGPWAETFFSRQATESFLTEASAVCAEVGTRLIVVDTPCLPYGFDVPFGVQRKAVAFAGQRPASKVDISIIVPVFDSSEYLEQCLLSLVGQKFRGTYEILAVDDGSTDNSADILHDFASRYANFRVLHQPNARQGMARNYGIHLAAGEYVTFVDSDDALTEDALANLWQGVRLNDTDVAAGLYCSYNVDTTASFINQSGFPFLLSPDVIRPEKWLPILRECSSVAKLVRRDLLIDRKIYFSGSYHEDEVFTSLLFATVDRVAVVKQIVYIYFARDNNSGTLRFETTKLRQILMVGGLLQEQLQSRDITPEAYDLKMGHLLQRYDRFFFKMSAGADSPQDQQQIVDILESEEIRGPFYRLIRALPDSLIEREALHFGLGLLLLKRGELEKATAFFRGNTRAGILHLIDEGVITKADVDRITGLSRRRNSYNYYQRHPVGKLMELAKPSVKPAPVPARPQKTVSVPVQKKTEEPQIVLKKVKQTSEKPVQTESFTFQVGDMIVSALRKPGLKTLMLPISLFKLYRKTKNRRDKRLSLQGSKQG